MNVWIPMIGVVAFILVAEALLWAFFRRKITGILFPHRSDVSRLRFFTLNRLRFLVLLHTITLSLLTSFSIFLVW